MKFPCAFIPLLLLPLAGCQPALHVTVADSALAPDFDPGARPRTLPGLPSNIRIGGCRLQSVWIEKQYLVTELPAGATKTLRQTDFTRFHSSTMGQFVFYQADSADTPLSPAQILAEPPDSHDLYLAGNTATLESMPDYSRTFYVNSGKPLTGSAQLDTKVGADGLLTEVSAQVQDQTLSTVLSFASGAVAASALSSDEPRHPAPPPPEPPKRRFQVVEHDYAHTFITLTPFTKGGMLPHDCVAPPAGLRTGSYTVAPTGKPQADDPAPRPKKPDDPKDSDAAGS